MIILKEETLEFYLSNGLIGYLFRVIGKNTPARASLFLVKANRQLDNSQYILEREIRPSINQIEGNHPFTLEHIRKQ